MKLFLYLHCSCWPILLTGALFFSHASMGQVVSAQTNLPQAGLTAPPPISVKDLPGASDVTGTIPLRLVSPGNFELGNVRVSKVERTVSFPALLNSSQGPQEYLLVTRYGKTHESVLATEIEPYLIHVAMLLLDATSTGTNKLSIAPQQQIKNPLATTLSGDKISIEVRWTVDGQEIRRPAEQLIYNTDAKAVLGSGIWVYNGSAVWDGKFLAQREGSIASLVTDPVALINNTGLGHDNDHIWTVNTNSLPPANVPLQVVIKLNPKNGK